MVNELGAGDRKKKLVPDRKYCVVDMGEKKRHKKATEHRISQINSGYYVPGTVLNASDIVTHVILKTTFQSKYHHYSCLIDEQTDAWRG